MGDPSTAVIRKALLNDMYAQTASPLDGAARATARLVDLFESLDIHGYRPAGDAEYPETEFGFAMRASAALIKANAGVEAIAVNLDGWDRHSFQGVLEGHMAELMENFSRTLAAFHRDVISSSGKRVTAVVMSEFGRVVSENASQGTDHGHGNVMFVLGAGIAGGRVFAEWSGLEREQRYQGQDLDVTTDYRDILSEVLMQRIQTQNLAAVFPGFTPRTRGVCWAT